MSRARGRLIQYCVFMHTVSRCLLVVSAGTMTGRLEDNNSNNMAHGGDMAEDARNPDRVTFSCEKNYLRLLES